MNILRQTKGKGVILVITLFLMLGLAFPASAMAQPTKDWEGHMAQEVIEAWMETGLVSGYEDGSFQPNKSISRVEFMAFANRAFNYTEKARAQYKDVSSSDWFAEVVEQAVAAGYIAGYTDGTMQPNNPITRKEAAAVLAKITGLSANVEATSKFSDQAQIPQWSRGAVGAVAQSSLMVGYPDGRFMPDKQITRGEAVAALNNAMGFLTRFDKAGTYGPESGSQTYIGNVVVLVQDVTLQNLVIKGNLVLDKGIGEGDVTLNNVIVEGDTFVRGGGVNSIHINGGQYKEIFIEKQQGRVRIVATNAEGIRVVMEAAATDKDNEVILEGDFDSVVVNVPQIKVTIQGETMIKQLEVTQKATDSNISLSSQVTVQKATIDTKTSFTGEGSIVEASGSAAKETSYEKEPIIIKDDSQPLPIGGGGGGGSSTPALSVSNIEIILAGGEKVNSVENLADQIRVEGIIFDVNAEGSVLKVTGIKPTIGSTINYDFTSETLPKSQATITFSDILGKPSISLTDLRGFFGSELTIQGILSRSGYSSYNEGLLVKLGEGGNAYENEWASLEHDGNTLKATIKKDVQLKDIGILNFLNSTFSELPSKVKVAGIEYVVIPGNYASIQAAFGSWDSMKIRNLVGMDIKMQREDSSVWYTLEVLQTLR